VRRLVAALFLVGASALAGESLTLENPRFGDWDDCCPVGWTVTIGAQFAEGPGSRLSHGPDGGLRLEGDAATRRWHFVGQPVTVESGATYRLRHVSRATGLRLDPGQTENAWVGIREAGPVRRFAVDAVLSQDWEPGEVVFRPGGDAVEVAVFLSKTGRLETREVSLERLRPEDSFDALVAHMDRYYPSFPVRKVDWLAHVAGFRERALAAATEAEFVSVLKEMLAVLDDLHVWIVRSDGRLVGTHSTEPDPNYDYRALAPRLSAVRQVGRIGFVADLEGGIAIAAIGSLQGTEEEHATLLAEIEARFDRRAFVIDLRANSGGDERHAQVIAALFADEPLTYAVRRFRSGAGHDDLGPPIEARVAPREGPRFAGPIACLVGPRCASSGEGFAQILAALPRATLVGLPTRGASASPQPLLLPNGVTVVFSRWLNFLPDGSLLETHGVPPDLRVEHSPPGDPTLDAALAHLDAALRRGDRTR
jgi:hypothetical protein